MSTSAKSRLLARLPHTAFKPGQSGNPRGRAPGTLNRVTREAREVAQRLVDDPVYLDALRARMIIGTAGAMEPLMWFYAKGKPVERIQQIDSRALSDLSDEELKLRLLDAAKTLSVK